MLRTVGESLTYSDALLSKPVNRFIAVEIGDCLEAYALLARRASARCRIWGGQKAAVNFTLRGALRPAGEADATRIFNPPHR
jgi:hypothetical protein